MNIVPSRFACLHIEDEDSKPNSNNKNNKNKTKKTPNASNNGTAKKPGKQAETKKSRKKNHEKQWEEWKEIDNVFVEDQYQGDLKSAILMSKLDYEEHKKPNGSQADKKDKKKKNKTISLNDFLNGTTNENETPENKSDENFFDTVASEAMDVLNKEKARVVQKQQDENIDEIIAISQYQDKLDREKDKSKKLQMEVDTLREELKTVKARNKALCDMLGHGEMKDKADVLSELEKLNSDKNELTAEVTRLHILLEQERSKVAALSSDNKHKKNKKHN